MARLSSGHGRGEQQDPDAVNVRVVAVLQQGISIDPRYGVSLDGLLASQIRAEQAHRLGPGTPGSVLDGGLNPQDGEDPLEVDLPLARCTIGGEEDWHWLTTIGQPVDHDGNPVPFDPDPHRMLGGLDERRAEQVAVSLPKNVGGPRGRFRNRVTPVLVVPAAAIVWHAVGQPAEIRRLLEPLTTIGARRGSGEGTVLRWEFSVVYKEDPLLFGHTHPDGTLGRPVPRACAERLGMSCRRLGYAGLRPPMFHPVRQRMLVLPDPTPQGG